ncbi:MAG: hypothetical protein C6I01_05915 [Epsilonproteobacteria bacterium]|nr:hypothetical protein [Campylobacterota bacterium]NPA89050.1 hypothetical protein [Campylobacterota bacterium]
MGKILFLIVVGVVIYILYKKMGEGKGIKSSGVGRGEEKEQVKKERGEQLEELIECEQCHTFVPAGEIRKVGGKNICKGCYENS